MRLTRMGAKKRPSYRVVVADSQAPRDGRHVEILGYYDPMTKPSTVRIDTERAVRWLHRPNRALGGPAPLTLLDTDLGAQQVEQLLGRIEHGVYS
jgi:ribosomal protein S16